MSGHRCVASPALRVAFVLQPKVCSSAIKRALMRAEGHDVEELSAEAIHTLDLLPNLRPSEARREGYLVATIVRNPFDRLVSVWANKVHDPHVAGTRLIRMGFEAGMSFRDFVARVDRVGIQAEGHLACQAGRAMTGEGALLVDFVGRYDRIRDDWARLRRLARGLPPLGRMNRSRHRHYRQHYDRETRNRVARLYADDVRLFGYRF